jgi:hypothetical protein
MNKDDSSSEDGVFVKSVLNKEIVYDEKTGRFFESKFGQGDCVPDEEYCYLDKSTGESIRLTVEEKERIFMDALQVCSMQLSETVFVVFMMAPYPDPDSIALT